MCKCCGVVFWDSEKTLLNSSFQLLFRYWDNFVSRSFDIGLSNYLLSPSQATRPGLFKTPSFNKVSYACFRPPLASLSVSTRKVIWRVEWELCYSGWLPRTCFGVQPCLAFKLEGRTLSTTLARLYSGDADVVGFSTRKETRRVESRSMVDQRRITKLKFVSRQCRNWANSRQYRTRLSGVAMETKA